MLKAELGKDASADAHADNCLMVFSSSDNRAVVEINKREAIEAKV